MKTLGRILIICFVFSFVSGLIIIAVNASGMNAPDFRGDGEERPEFRPDGDMDGGFPFPADGERGERGEGGGSRLMFGLIKNVIVIAVLRFYCDRMAKECCKEKKTPATTSVG